MDGAYPRYPRLIKLLGTRIIGLFGEAGRGRTELVGGHRYGP
jgi:hypothetical protein